MTDARCKQIKAGDKLTVYRVYKTGALSDPAFASQPKYHTEVTVESVTDHDWKGTSVNVSGKFKNIPQLWIEQTPGWDTKKQDACINTVLKTECHQKTKNGDQLFYRLVVVTDLLID